jgi:hypothetical protein
MKRLPLSMGLFALVDDEWFEYLNQWKWYARKSHNQNTFYVLRNKYKPFHVTIFMHNLIMSPPNGLEVDHKDGNGLNNQRQNLRVCTSTKNKFNKGKYRTNKSGYKGVSWYPKYGKWQAQIQANKKKMNLGYFTDKIEAALAYNKAALKHHGEFARLNRIDR